MEFSKRGLSQGLLSLPDSLIHLPFRAPALYGGGWLEGVQLMELSDELSGCKHVG